MDNDNLNVSHLAWCGLIALHTARQDWMATSPAQDNLFLTRWLASDIRWLLKEGREKGLRHVVSAVKLAGWIYRTLSDSEWHGRKALRLSPSVSGIYLNRHALDAGFDEHGRQRIPLPARITGELPALDKLLQRSGWRREAAGGADEHLHHLLADGFSAA